MSEYGLVASQSTAAKLKNLVADGGENPLQEVASQEQQLAWIKTGTSVTAGWHSCVVCEMVSGTWDNYTLACECQDLNVPVLARNTRYLARRTGDSSTGVARWVVAGVRASGWIKIEPYTVKSDQVGPYATNGRVTNLTFPTTGPTSWTDGEPVIAFPTFPTVTGVRGGVLFVGSRYWGHHYAWGTTATVGVAGDPVWMVQGEPSMHGVLVQNPGLSYVPAVGTPGASGYVPPKISLSWTMLLYTAGGDSLYGYVGYDTVTRQQTITLS